MRRAPLLALLVLHCSGEKDTTGFQGTAGGPSSFDPSTGAPTTGDLTAATSTSSAASSDTGLTPTTGDPVTTTTSTTGDPTTGTTAVAPVCGDGTVDPGEQCDDGDMSDGGPCLSDCTVGHALLALVGRGDDPAAIAMFDPVHGWTTADATYDLGAAAIVSTPDGAHAVIRRAGADPDAEDELHHTRWMDPDPDLLKSSAPVGDFGFTLDAPALASVPDTLTLAFLGTDFKHYVALYSGDAWGPFEPLPAATLDVQAFGPGGAALAPGQLETYAVYAGDDDRVYVAKKPQWNAAWEASIQAPPPAVVDTIRPAAVVDPGGDLVLAYVRKSDNQIGLTRRSAADNTWSLEILVDPQARTDAPVALLRTDAGAWLIAWRHFDNAGISFSRSADLAAWDPPTVVELPASTTPPQLVPGILDADAELLYTAAGALHHARITAGRLTAPQPVDGLAAATTVAACRVQLEP